MFILVLISKLIYQTNQFVQCICHLYYVLNERIQISGQHIRTTLVVNIYC